MRRRALLSGSVATLATLPGAVRAQWVDCGATPLQPVMVTSAGPCGDPPSLDLTFMAPGSLDPRITFTRSSTGTYFDAAGVMQTAVTNAPRWNHDATGLRGLLLEDARTNALLNSGPLGSAYMVAATRTDAATVAPDGTTTGVRIVDNTANGEHAIDYGSISVASGTTYTFSVFIKPGSRRYAGIGLRAWAAGDTIVMLDGLTGALSTYSGTPVASSVTRYGGWYRVSLTGTASAASSGVVLRVGMIDDSGQQSYVGTGLVDTFVWGVQFEVGAFPTSYVLTTSTAVARAADSCTITPANLTPWWTPPGGSWFAEFIGFNPAGGGSGTRIIEDTSASSVASIIMEGGGRHVGQYDSVSSILTANELTANAITRAATTWAVGSAKVCLNGGTVATTAAMTQGYGAHYAGGIRLMANGTTTDGMSGYLRRVGYWSRVLSNAEMQTVTS